MSGRRRPGSIGGLCHGDDVRGDQRDSNSRGCRAQQQQRHQARQQHLKNKVRGSDEVLVPSESQLRQLDLFWAFGIAQRLRRAFTGAVMPWQTDIDRPPSALVHGGPPRGPECVGCHGCIGQPGFAGPQPTLQSLRGAGCMQRAPSSRAQSSRMPSSRAASCPPPMTPHLKLPTFRATKPPRALPQACLPLDTFLRPATRIPYPHTMLSHRYVSPAYRYPNP